ncbi:MAG: hypothetical protein MUP81_05440 [Dehalococcoidia bacterium]|nr:hypothetical protein [Dehalococcoidia bacterium]
MSKFLTKCLCRIVGHKELIKFHPMTETGAEGYCICERCGKKLPFSPFVFHEVKGRELKRLREIEEGKQPHEEGK